jgi:hypothetical protein
MPMILPMERDLHVLEAVRQERLVEAAHGGERRARHGRVLGHEVAAGRTPGPSRATPARVEIAQVRRVDQ